MRRFFCLLLALSGCTFGPPIQPEPRYEVGQPYQLGGFWSYPREEFSRVETGLGVVEEAAGPRRTGNGEVWEAAAMLATHRSLQLPAIITLTNLENGRSLSLRVNDRGPEQAGRMASVSRRAGELLGVAPGAVFQARLEVQGEASRALAEGLVQGATTNTPALAMTAAPVGRVERESLAPPEGARAGAARAAAAGRTRPTEITEANAAGLPPLRLAEELRQGAAMPGRLFLDAGNYFTYALAQRQAGRIGARAEPVGPRSRQQEFRLRAGPFATVAEADAALGRARAVGFPELRIVVE
jgi:rare lipoprotein A